MKEIKRRLDQRGITSLMVTMLLMVITSLVVLAFAQLSRREQRTALDNQLSTQAYYAAEAGINDAKEAIQTAINNNNPLPIDPDCNNETTNPTNTRLDGNPNVRYTCLTINPSPTSLTGTVNAQGSTVFHIKASTPFSTINNPGLKISWQKSSSVAATNCPSESTQHDLDITDEFSPNTTWNCPFGILRYDLTQIPASFNASTLAGLTQTAFVVPKRPSIPTQNPVLFTPGQGNRVQATQCDANVCNVIITGLTGTDYYLNLRTIYGFDSAVTISRANPLDTTPFKDSQVQIDATGKAQDVLKRIRVAVNLTSGGGNSAALAVGDGPCKQQFLSVNSDGSYYYSNPGSCPE